MPGKDESRGKREFTAFLTVWGGQKARFTMISATGKARNLELIYALC